MSKNENFFDSVSAPFICSTKCSKLPNNNNSCFFGLKNLKELRTIDLSRGSKQVFRSELMSTAVVFPFFIAFILLMSFLQVISDTTYEHFGDSHKLPFFNCVSISFCQTFQAINALQI